MSPASVRARLTTATVTAVAAALVVPVSAGATAAPTRGTDVVEVTGTVRVLAGEDGHPDTYSIETAGGRLIRLAGGLEADPGSSFRGSLVVPGAPASSGLTARARRVAALARAERAGGVVARDVRVASPRPAAGNAPHTTYVAKLTDLGAFSVSDADLLRQIAGAQQYWVRESGGVIPSWSTATAVTPATSAAASVAGGCGLGANGAQFDAIVGDVGSRLYPGVDFSGDSTNHLVVVVPSACANSEAVGRGRRGVSLDNGGPVIAIEAPGVDLQGTLEHEFGHNVGLQHSNNSRAEYGGLYEVMGGGVMTKTSPALGTVYRWEQGLVGADEWADGSAGGSWSLASRAAASGLRSVVLIDPDTGKRLFVDYRDGAGIDATATYAGGGGVYPAFGQSYSRGVVVERENEDRGSFLMDVPGNDGALQAGEQWSNQSGSVVVRATAANAVQVVRTPQAPLGAGSASIAGTAEPLRQASATGSVPGATSYRYQWLLDGQPIPQADDATFTPAPFMAGHKLGVQVVGYAVGRDPSPAATATVTVPRAKWYVATGTRDKVSIKGKARVGSLLTAVGADWINYVGVKPAGYAPTYVWTRNGKKIKKASKATYRLTVRDRGKRIQVREVPRAPGYSTSSFVRSSATRKVRIGKLASPRPRVGGKAKVGKRLVARTPGWTRGTRFRYQWFAGKRAIRGAHGKKLRVTRSLKGDKVSVRVTGTKKGFRPATEKSRAVKIRKK